jgi:hypothetical protein
VSRQVASMVLGALVFLGGISLTVYGSLTRARLHQPWAREEAMTLDDASTGSLSPIYPDPAVHILDQKFNKY